MLKMKNRAVVALFVAFLLSLPARPAQPANSTTSDQSQAASSQTAPSGDTATGKLRCSVTTRVSGEVACPQEIRPAKTQPIRDRINELDELTSANSKMIKDGRRAQQGSASFARPLRQTSTPSTPAHTQAQTTATGQQSLTTVEGVSAISTSTVHQPDWKFASAQDDGAEQERQVGFG
jgi:hypothetical protein